MHQEKICKRAVESYDSLRSYIHSDYKLRLKKVWIYGAAVRLNLNGSWTVDFRNGRVSYKTRLGAPGTPGRQSCSPRCRKGRTPRTPGAFSAGERRAGGGWEERQAAARRGRGRGGPPKAITGAGAPPGGLRAQCRRGRRCRPPAALARRARGRCGRYGRYGRPLERWVRRPPPLGGDRRLLGRVWFGFGFFLSFSFCFTVTLRHPFSPRGSRLEIAFKDSPCWLKFLISVLCVLLLYNQCIWTFKHVKWERDFCLKITTSFFCHIQQTKDILLEQHTKTEQATVWEVLLFFWIPKESFW